MYYKTLESVRKIKTKTLSELNAQELAIAVWKFLVTLVDSSKKKREIYAKRKRVFVGNAKV